MEIFSIANLTTFKYYPHFIGLYTFLVAFSFIAKAVVLKQKDKNIRKLYKKSFFTFFSSCFWIGTLGFLYLAARKYRVSILSMEFLHILNIILLATFLGFGIKKYLHLKKRMKI